MKTLLKPAVLAAALALTACAPGPANDGRRLPETAAGAGPIALPPYLRPVALRAAVTGVPEKEAGKIRTVLRLYDTRRSEKLALPMRGDGVAVYGLRPGHYAIDRIAGYACGPLDFTIGSRDGMVALGTWTLAIDPQNPKRATLSAVPLDPAQRRAVTDGLEIPYAARNAISARPWRVDCGLGADDRFGGHSAGEVAVMSVLGVAGLATGLATGNPTVLIMIGG